MGPATEEVLQAALALPEEERLELVEALLATHAPSHELPFDPVWLDEARRRSAEVESGAVQPETWEVVRERVRRRLEGQSRD
ncbi:addiction module protein [Paludisphaera rhizosphaerae]|uniref:addiction module protein n=1 Tax=Paludisphaera rhizosphaerae TaxID=2711216 RepID=UPI0013EAE73E|nr:addiction module protein [Paludisphaera rhizosphaerae]